MKKFMLEDAEALINAEMETVKGGTSMAACADCCTEGNRGGNVHINENEREAH